MDHLGQAKRFADAEPQRAIAHALIDVAESLRLAHPRPGHRWQQNADNTVTCYYCEAEASTTKKVACPGRT